MGLLVGIVTTSNSYIFQNSSASVDAVPVIPESFDLLATLKVASLHIIDGTSLRRIAQFLDQSTVILVILAVLILWLLKAWSKFSFRIEAPQVSPLKLAIVNLSLIAILYISYWIIKIAIRLIKHSIKTYKLKNENVGEGFSVIQKEFEERQKEEKKGFDLKKELAVLWYCGILAFLIIAFLTIAFS